jgi:hypothetical protein
MNDAIPDDPLERLLLADESDAAPELRARLRQATLGCVRRNRRVRQLCRLGAVTSVLLALAALWYIRFNRVQDERANPRISVNVQPVPQKTEPAPAVTTPVSAADLEWQAFDSQGEERSRRYFQAGNRYLEMEADYASALRCYSQALADVSPRDLEFTPDDSWLLLTLKNARRQGVNQ